MKHTISVPVTDDHLVVISGITYAQVPYWFPCNYKDLKLDIIRPMRQAGKAPGERPDKRPLFVWCCGGAMLTLEKAAHLPWLIRLAKRGWVVASIEYRLSNSAAYPAAVMDAKAAIRYLRAHADEYGIDPDHVVIGGESAGSTVSCLTTATSNVKMFDEKTPWDTGAYTQYSSAVSAGVCFYGTSDFRPKEGGPNVPSLSARAAWFAPVTDPERAARLSACTYLNENTPPYFLAHGNADFIVPIDSTSEFYDQLMEKGIRADYHIVEGVSHAAPEFYEDAMLDKLIAFLDETVLNKKTAGADAASEEGSILPWFCAEEKQ